MILLSKSGCCADSSGNNNGGAHEGTEGDQVKHEADPQNSSQL
jgi:hypothetical protein